MPRLRTFLLSAVLAAAAVWMMRLHIEQAWRDAGLDDLVLLVIAAKDVPPGEVLTREHVRFGQIPRRFLHPGLVSVSDPAAEIRVLGLPVRSRLTAGQPVVYADVRGGADGTPPVAERVPLGMRALALAVNQVSSVGNHVAPGNRVDIVGTFSLKDGRRVTRTLVENLLVLATGDELTGVPAGCRDQNTYYSNLTVLLSPELAELLVLAGDRGELSFTLRNPKEASEGRINPAEFAQLVHLAVPRPPPPPRRGPSILKFGVDG